MVHLVIKNFPAVLTELVTAVRICKVIYNYCHHIWTSSEADHSSPSRAKVMKAWSYTFTPPYVIMVWYLSRGKTLSYILQCNY